MKKTKRKKLKAAGWRVGDAADFLDLTQEEAALVEIKIALAKSLHALRRRRELTQDGLAQLLGSSQSRVAKMEAADASVSIDLLVRSLLALGATAKEVARAVSKAA